MDHWRGKGEVIQFKKKGQKYDIWVNFVVKKGLFKDGVMDKEFRVFPSDYSYYKTRDAPFTCGKDYEDREVKNQMKHSVVPAKRRKEDYILVGGIVVFIIVFLSFFIWEKQKKEKFKRRR